MTAAAESAALRVVSWNCARDLGIERAARLLTLAPDVAVVQECSATASLDGLVRVAYAARSPTKGIGIFAKRELLPAEMPVPVVSTAWCAGVTLQALDLQVIGVWGFQRNGQAGPPRSVARDAIDALRPVLNRGRSVVVGDFNDGPQFDTGYGHSFRRTWDLLGDIGYTSVYHQVAGEPYGRETAVTSYHMWDRTRPFFIDHVFGSPGWMGDVREFSIGHPDEWLRLSDHMPVAATFLVRPAPSSHPPVLG